MSKRLFLILLSSELDRNQVTRYFDTIPDKISNWFFGFPYSLFIESELNVKDVSELIYKQFGYHSHLVLAVEDNYWGIQSKEFWDKFPLVPDERISVRELKEGKRNN